MMGKPNFSDEFKRDAVAQITERGYPVAKVSQRLGVSQHSLYAWKRQLGKVVPGDTSKDAEIRQLKRELARVTEEHDILKNCRRQGPPVCGRNGSWYGSVRRVAADSLLVV
jgi:transposase